MVTDTSQGSLRLQVYLQADSRGDFLALGKNPEINPAHCPELSGWIHCITLPGTDTDTPSTTSQMGVCSMAFA